MNKQLFIRHSTYPFPRSSERQRSILLPVKRLKTPIKHRTNTLPPILIIQHHRHYSMIRFGMMSHRKERPTGERRKPRLGSNEIRHLSEQFIGIQNIMLVLPIYGSNLRFFKTHYFPEDVILQSLNGHLRYIPSARITFVLTPIWLKT